MHKRTPTHAYWHAHPAHLPAHITSAVQVSIGEDGGVTIKGKYSDAKVIVADVEAGDASEWAGPAWLCVRARATSGARGWGGVCCQIWDACRAAGGWATPASQALEV
jgi:hypothetical protein